MRKANLKEIKRTLSEYKVSGLINHSVKKLFVTWSDGNSRFYERLAQDMNDNNISTENIGIRIDEEICRFSSFVSTISFFFSFSSILDSFLSSL